MRHKHSPGSQLILLLPGWQMPIHACADKSCQAVAAEGEAHWYRGFKSLLSVMAPDADLGVLLAAELVGDWVVVYHPWLVFGIEEEPIIPILRMRRKGDRWHILTPTCSVRVWHGRQSRMTNRWRAIGGVQFRGDASGLLRTMPEGISGDVAPFSAGVNAVLRAWQASNTISEGGEGE